MANENGAPKDVDREIVNLFTVFDENASAYLDQNIAEFAPKADPEDQGFRESNLMHAINGYVYGNLPGLNMQEGEKVRWYLIGLGTEVDLHTPHWHGNTVLSGGHRTDVIDLLPASMKTVTMRSDNPGAWMYHCHVNDHIDAGMSFTPWTERWIAGLSPSIKDGVTEWRREQNERPLSISDRDMTAIRT